MGVAALFLLSLVVCFYDWQYRIIPNRLCGVILALSLGMMVYRGAYPDFSNIILIVFLSLLIWKLGIWGAGDSKLLLAFTPLVDSQFYVATVAFIGLTGCATAIIFLMYRRLSQRCEFKTVPYGIPIALSCFVTSVASL